MLLVLTRSSCGALGDTQPLERLPARGGGARARGRLAGRASGARRALADEPR